jgi:hypothetical protein
MKVFGHEWIESEHFYEVTNENEISKTPTNSLLKLHCLTSSLELAKYCQSNDLRYALEIESIKEAIFANLLNASYILCSKTLAKELMPIAQNYLFDTLILAYVKENEIEEMAKIGVDGVVIAYR